MDIDELFESFFPERNLNSEAGCYINTSFLSMTHRSQSLEESSTIDSPESLMEFMRLPEISFTFDHRYASDSEMNKYKCTVEGCKKTFQHYYRLKQHLVCHSPVKAFKCEECFRSYKRQSDLKRHLKKGHVEKRQEE